MFLPTAKLKKENCNIESKSFWSFQAGSAEYVGQIDAKVLHRVKDSEVLDSESGTASFNKKRYVRMVSSKIL